MPAYSLHRATRTDLPRLFVASSRTGLYGIDSRFERVDGPIHSDGRRRPRATRPSSSNSRKTNRLAERYSRRPGRASRFSLVAFTGERISAHDEDFQPDLSQHMAAYRACLPFVSEKVVLDSGCGEGYGARCLAAAPRPP